MDLLYYIFSYYSLLQLFILLLKLSHLWPLGVLSIGFYVLMTYPLFCFLCISLLPGTTGCPGIIIFISCSGPGISYFSKEVLCLLLTYLFANTWRGTMLAGRLHCLCEVSFVFGITVSGQNTIFYITQINTIFSTPLQVRLYQIFVIQLDSFVTVYMSCYVTPVSQLSSITLRNVCASPSQTLLPFHTFGNYWSVFYPRKDIFVLFLISGQSILPLTVMYDVRYELITYIHMGILTTT